MYVYNLKNWRKKNKEKKNLKIYINIWKSNQGQKKIEEKKNEKKYTCKYKYKYIYV